MTWEEFVHGIARRIWRIRRGARLTQKEFAQQIGVSATAVSQWETGEWPPKVDALARISKRFNVTIDELVFGEDL